MEVRIFPDPPELLRPSDPRYSHIFNMLRSDDRTTREILDFRSGNEVGLSIEFQRNPTRRLAWRETITTWGHSSDGRAPALHAGGRRFDPAWLHHFTSDAD